MNSRLQEHLDKKEFDAALDVGQTLLSHSSDQSAYDGELRAKTFTICRDLLAKLRDLDTASAFFLAEAERYRKVFGADLHYLTFIGEHAELMQQKGRPDLAKQVYELLSEMTSLPDSNRFTARFDVAMYYYDRGDVFQAMELLKEIVATTKGTGAYIARKNMSSSAKLEDVAFESLKKIRLFANGEGALIKCCGESVLPVPTEVEIETMNPIIKDLSVKLLAGTPANPSEPAIKEIIRTNMQHMLPVLAYRLTTETDEQTMNHLLIFIGHLGTNGAPLVPKLVPMIMAGKHENNALLALGKIGRPAACSIPALIIATEEHGISLRRNAEWALKYVGPAPRETIPVLAGLLYHSNNSICLRAADAIAASVKIDRSKGASKEERLQIVRDWWEHVGSKESWTQIAQQN